jgi:alanine-synthesizing transaminase
MSSNVSKFSRRLPPHAERNAISLEVERVRASAIPFIDLTESNPTTAGFDYPADLLTTLAAPAALRYEPRPFGMETARGAIALDCARRGVAVSPDQVVLSASTSESYSWLFKLLCDPGESVLVPRPSYPLFEQLTTLEGVRAVPYDLTYHGRWEIDTRSLQNAPDDVRAVLVVSPNNPTGSYLSRGELDALSAICAARGWAIVADEVFADYPLDEQSPVTDIAQQAGVLAFTLGGASKMLGLPQVKLGWIVVGGPVATRDAALSALELIADTFLSVSTPVQVAAPTLLDRGGVVRRQIQDRTSRNLARARALVRNVPACEILRTEGGWSTVLRVPATIGEEHLVIDLLRRHGVLVHPGYFFDFAHEAFIVVSLLPRTDIFEDGIMRVLRATAS